MKHTKIVCTIGPSSEKREVLVKLIKAGMNVARLNFSHGTYSNHSLLIRNIRSASKKAGEPVAIMQDLQGPRIRVGLVRDEGINARTGDKLVLAGETFLQKHPVKIKELVIPIQYEELYQCILPGHTILIKDGLIELRVDQVKKELIYCSVRKPGLITSHRGINLPNTLIKTSVITTKDQEDLKFGISQEVDFVSMSFVRNGKDILEMRELINKFSKGRKIESRPKIIAKIERREAVNNFSEILSSSDGIMVARGDLGIEVSAADVPIIQKGIITQCLKLGKPVIVATQMLESMMENPRPTRAEASDVANAVIDHTDAVMLSGETATGKYPVETVKIMSEIIIKTEQSPYDDIDHGDIRYPEVNILTAVSDEDIELLSRSAAKAILISSHSGYTARMIARYRPGKMVVAITDLRSTHNQLILSSGVRAVLVNKLSKDSVLLEKQLINVALKNKIIRKGQKVITVITRPINKKDQGCVIREIKA